MGTIVIYLGSQTLFSDTADNLQDALLKVKKARHEFRSNDVWGEFTLNGFYQMIS